MEFTKFDTKAFEVKLNSVVDQFEKGTNSALAYVQPESFRDALTTLNDAYFDLTRSSLKQASKFGDVLSSVATDVTKTAKSALKTA